jgi:hypothetical protein
MILSENERQLFFSNWLGLLAFINNKYQIEKDFGYPKSPVGLKGESILSIKTKLWENIDDIEEYIDSVWDMPRENIQILKRWKKRISGKFIILKHSQKYSVFLSNALYGVVGITSPISEVINNRKLPIFAETVLIPFGEHIIYDSILSTYKFIIGPNMRRDFNEEYKTIKKEKGIITQL